jgi:hypothetical protein
MYLENILLTQPFDRCSVFRKISTMNTLSVTVREGDGECLSPNPTHVRVGHPTRLSEERTAVSFVHTL